MSNFLIGLSDVQRLGQNYIINGNMDFWQRGTSLGAGTGNRYLADRFLSASNNSTIAPSQQLFTVGQTAVPNNPRFFHRSVVVSSAGVGNNANLQQRLENVAELSGKTITLSFWAKADSTKPISIEFAQVFDSATPNVFGIGVQKINLTSSWQRFTRTVTLPSVTGATLGANNFFAFNLWFDAGSNFNSRTDSLGQQSGTFDIAQVKLEEGSVATPFTLAGGTIAGELVACQRFYEVGEATFTSTPARDSVYLAVPFKVSKRGTPAVTRTGNGSITADTAGSVTSSPSLDRFYFFKSASSIAIGGSWTADAEL
jgi:hypothetical protein